MLLIILPVSYLLHIQYSISSVCTYVCLDTNIAIVTIIVMAGNIIKKKGLTYLLGVCVPSAKQNAAKIRVKLPDFDTHLLMVRKFNVFS